MHYHLITLDTIVSYVYSHAKNLSWPFSDSAFIIGKPKNQVHNFLPRVPAIPLGSSVLGFIVCVWVQMSVTIYTLVSLRISLKILFLREGKNPWSNEGNQQEF